MPTQHRASSAWLRNKHDGFCTEWTGRERQGGGESAPEWVTGSVADVSMPPEKARGVPAISFRGFTDVMPTSVALSITPPVVTILSFTCHRINRITRHAESYSTLSHVRTLGKTLMDAPASVFSSPEQGFTEECCEQIYQTLLKGEMRARMQELRFSAAHAARGAAALPPDRWRGASNNP
jgi:hypothetical protein